MSSGKYVGLGPRDTTESPFPDTYLNLRELIYFRSWQASGIIPFYYYFMLVLALFYFLYVIIIETIALGAGGFFLGLLFGTLRLLFVALFARVTSEIFLSIFDIRDNIYKQTVNASAPIAHHQPAQYPSQSASSSNNNNADFGQPYNGNL
ncbi:hypothetical protein SAMD00019534_108110 [Acytostelium subglobosum LB1]|uniref:hypothetical protein n=1 Tax=Acytostelium subglobosum LB1 TaxID=1410327 RepID=UPI000644E6A9|nr:hypothetical protein SAMD00019534_108110 [Acytostelium subglobosum LB1]GAM27635.1 hypothetical protein SAMD00019534_108110 [Acytostelium subglobosum LB1]|eukprot:XP_012749294.1 hypothetical protein SAMD00019534_108110 [Acytostelium subglobosum LB1]